MQADFVMDVPGFSLADTLCCGQCFRWTCENGEYIGTAGRWKLRLAQQGDRLFVRGAGREPGEPFLRQLFGLDEDYAAFHRLLRRDAMLRRAVDYAPGIRVMKQPLWETTCTFILSQNNNIPRIAGIVGRLCAQFGTPGEGGAQVFPAPQALAGLTPETLTLLRAGFRAKYVLDAARRFAGGEIDEQAVRTAPLDSARAMLMGIQGVGPKVADCALLFGAARYDAFPADVWVKRAMAALFPAGLPAEVVPIAGIAQQYIFHYARTSGVLGSPPPAKPPG